MKPHLTLIMGKEPFRSVPVLLCRVGFPLGSGRCVNETPSHTDKGQGTTVVPCLSYFAVQDFHLAVADASVKPHPTLIKGKEPFRSVPVLLCRAGFPLGSGQCVNKTPSHTDNEQGTIS